MSPKRILLIILKASVSISLMIWVVRSSGTGSIRTAFGAINFPFFILAVICFAASGVLGTFQWYLLMKHHKLNIRYREALAYYFTGLFFNNFLLSYIGGDAYRIFTVGKKTQQGTVAFSTTLADRAIGLFMLSSLSVIAYFISSGIKQEAMLPLIGGVFVVILVVFSLILFRGPGLLIGRLLKRTVPPRSYETLKKIYWELRSLRYEPRLAFIFLVISFGVQFLRIAVHYLCARSIGITAEFHWFLILIPLVAIAASLPISIGGIGVREKFATVLFLRIGVAEGLATTMELLSFASGIIASIPGGIHFTLAREKTV